MRSLIRSFLAEPRFPNPPRRTRWDWILVGVVAVIGLLEGIFGGVIGWRVATTVISVSFVPVILWRRSHPLRSTAVAFAVGGGLFVLTELVAEDASLFASSGLAAVVILYALTRWGSGREIAIGVSVVLAVHIVSDLVDAATSLGDTAVGSVLWLFVAAVGLMVRSRAQARLSAIDEARLREREQLARELHDTVAHHVSAIAIQAQAGRAVAATRPEFAATALETIEEQASRTLAEMRRMVGALRASEGATTAPQRGVDDIRHLAHPVPGSPPVTVDLEGNLDDLPPSVEAGLYRLTQEAITNARRHARHATRFAVCIVGEENMVRLQVSDDGDPIPRDPTGSGGFGLVGMEERAALLGGTLSAGPGPDRGWIVSAELPRTRMTA